MENLNQDNNTRSYKKPQLLIKDLYKFVCTAEGKDELRVKMFERKLTFSEAQYIWEYLLSLENFQDVELVNDLCQYMDDIFTVEIVN